MSKKFPTPRTRYARKRLDEVIANGPPTVRRRKGKVRKRLLQTEPEPEHEPIIEPEDVIRYFTDDLPDKDPSPSLTLRSTLHPDDCGSVFPFSHDIVRERPDDSTPRVRGEMVWLHKTAPILQIEGKPTLTADDYRKGRRRE